MVDGIHETAQMGSMMPSYQKIEAGFTRIQKHPDNSNEIDEASKSEKMNHPILGSTDENKDLGYDKTTTKNILEEGTVVFERYDEKGRLIQRIPPGYVPISEMA